MGVSENIIKYRKIKGYTQDELAEAMGVSRQSVSKWENGESMPDINRIIKLAEYLDVSLDCLFDRENPVKTEQNIVAKQDKKIGFKRSWAISILIALILLILGGLLGFFIGRSIVGSSGDDSVQAIQVGGVSATVDDHGQTILEFVVSSYNEDYNYMVYATSVGEPIESKIKGKVRFNDGKCKCTLNLMDYYWYKAVLEVEYKGETQYYTLAETLVSGDGSVRIE